MLEARLHVVMGRASVSVWCRSHGPEHLLWSGQAWRWGDSPADMLTLMADALGEAACRAHRGELEDLTDDCGL